MDTLIATTEEKMQKTVKLLNTEYSELRAGRANANVLDKIRVDYYGTPTPINQMAAVSVSEARILTIQPWDKSTIHAIEKAIQASDIGINPQNDGVVIRLIFPQLTEERRKDLSKDVRKMAEDSRVAVRSIRRDAIEKAKKIAERVLAGSCFVGADRVIQSLRKRFCFFGFHNITPFSYLDAVGSDSFDHALNPGCLTADRFSVMA